MSEYLTLFCRHIWVKLGFVNSGSISLGVLLVPCIPRLFHLHSENKRKDLLTFVPRNSYRSAALWCYAAEMSRSQAGHLAQRAKKTQSAHFAWTDQTWCDLFHIQTVWAEPLYNVLQTGRRPSSEHGMLLLLNVLMLCFAFLLFLRAFWWQQYAAGWWTALFFVDSQIESLRSWAIPRGRFYSSKDVNYQASMGVLTICLQQALNV